MFVQDRSVATRSCFYKTMAKLLIDLPDRVDMEGRIFPYLISGLYDHNDGIRATTFELIEEIGLQHEDLNEEKFRELKQFGYVPEWLHSGLVKDEDVTLPEPLSHRPTLGARILVRSYVRRYLKALYHEIGAWIQDHQERAANLLMYSICYVEEFMTQYLDHLLVAMYKAILNKENKVVQTKVPMCYRLLGRYVAPKSYSPLIIAAIRNELASFYTTTGLGSLKAFGYMFAGSIELLPSGQDLGNVRDLLSDFVKAVADAVIPSIDIETSRCMVESLDVMVTELIKKQSEGVDVRAVREHLPKIAEFLLHA